MEFTKEELIKAIQIADSWLQESEGVGILYCFNYQRHIDENPSNDEERAYEILKSIFRT